MNTYVIVAVTALAFTTGTAMAQSTTLVPAPSTVASDAAEELMPSAHRITVGVMALPSAPMLTVEMLMP